MAYYKCNVIPHDFYGRWNLVWFIENKEGIKRIILVEIKIVYFLIKFLFQSSGVAICPVTHILKQLSRTSPAVVTTLGLKQILAYWSLYAALYMVIALVEMAEIDIKVRHSG
jgi:hypothetical protein